MPLTGKMNGNLDAGRPLPVERYASVGPEAQQQQIRRPLVQTRDRGSEVSRAEPQRLDGTDGFGGDTLERVAKEDRVIGAQLERVDHVVHFLDGAAEETLQVMHDGARIAAPVSDEGIEHLY